MPLAASLKLWLSPRVQDRDDLVFPSSMKANHPTKLIVMSPVCSNEAAMKHNTWVNKWG